MPHTESGCVNKCIDQPPLSCSAHKVYKIINQIISRPTGNQHDKYRILSYNSFILHTSIKKMHRTLIQQGLRFLEEGQLDKAGYILSLLINSYPDNADGHHMLGIIELEKGNFNDAFILVNTAIDLNPQNSLFYNTMGNIELHRKNIAEAENAFLNAIKYNDEKIEYKFNIANFYLTQNRYAEAIEYYYFILRTNPTHYLSIRGITVCYLYSGETDIALEHATEWVEQFNEYDEPYYYLGLCYFALNDLTAALSSYDNGLSICPTNHDIIAAIGACYRALGNTSIAESYIHNALSLNPHSPTAIYHLACLHLDKGDIDSARDLFTNSFNLDHRYADPICGLGMVELAQGNDNLALKHFMHAQDIEPTNAYAKALTATTLLRQQNYAPGWQLYNRILTVPEALQTIPLWDGKKLLNNQSLLVWFPKENSDLGMRLMFASMLPDLQKKSINAVILCDHSLVNLLKYSFNDFTVISELGFDEINDGKYSITHQIPVSSLGQYFRASAHDFPTHTNNSYLTANPERVAHYKEKYKKLFPHKSTIGIAWKALSSHNAVQQTKSTHINNWTKLLQVRKFQFISLQNGDALSEITTINETIGNTIYQDLEIRFDNNFDLLEIAAQLSALDGIITVDSYIAHLAGALGLKVYVLVAIQSEWYWGKEREKSTWYPSMQLVRQTKPGVWSQTIESIENFITKNK